MIYNYFRDYEPRTGRYIQSDPIGLEGGPTLNVYVGGNPLSAVDPKGLAAAGRAIGGQVGRYAGDIVGEFLRGGVCQKGFQ